MQSHHQVVGKLPRVQVAQYLREIGDEETAKAIENVGQAGGQSFAVPFRQYCWSCANHLIGFVEPRGTGGSLEIESATSIKAQKELIGNAIKVTLNKFHVHDYPGLPNHKVVLEFAGRSQATTKKKEELRFSTTCEVGDRDSTKAGAPIFVDVRVPADGLALEGRTVNVKSKGDEVLLGILRSKTFKHGLTLLGSVQPALPLLTQMSTGVVEHLLSQSKNKPVQEFELGLDFSASGTSAQLRLGSYVVVQVPEDGSWGWSNWRYNQDAMAVVHVETGKPLEANYLILGVSQSSGDTVGDGGKKDKADGKGGKAKGGKK